MGNQEDLSEATFETMVAIITAIGRHAEAAKDPRSVAELAKAYAVLMVSIRVPGEHSSEFISQMMH